MGTLKWLIPVGIVFVGLLGLTSATFGKPEYTKKEKKACTYCHTKANDKELNDAGKYYQEHNHSLDGYKK